MSIDIKCPYTFNGAGESWIVGTLGSWKKQDDQQDHSSHWPKPYMAFILIFTNVAFRDESHC